MPDTTGAYSKIAETTGRALVAFQSCGCWSAVQVEYGDFAEQTREAARFVKETGYHGVVRYEMMPMDAFQALKNGVNGDLTHGCDHEPKWGGDAVTHDDCPRCFKTVKVKQDGTLYAHKDGWQTCSQEPWPRLARAARGDSPPAGCASNDGGAL